MTATQAPHRAGVGAGPVAVAVVGCGAVSEEYLSNLVSFPDIRVVGCADLDVDRARRAARQHGIPMAADLATVLADPEVEIVVNLTIPAAHTAVARAALRAGKHVYGEKPLALERADGNRLLAEAAALGLRIGNAPDTLLGPGLQTCQRLVAEGLIGEPLSGLACFQDPGPEVWHPNPEFLFQHGAGPLLDLGPYYLTTLVQLFGPVSRVAAADRRGRAQRVIGSGPMAGGRFAVQVPTHVTAIVEFAAGQVATLVLSFDSPSPRHGFVEITGADATLRVPDPNQFGGPALIRAPGQDEWRELPVPAAVAGRGLGVLDMARAIRAGEPHRASGELALHVLDAMTAIAESARRGEFVTLPEPSAVASAVGAAAAEPSVAPELLPERWNPHQPLLAT